MGARRYIHEAVGLLLTARRRAELHKYPKEILYNIEVLIRACSRVGDQIEEENRAKQIKKAEEKLKAYQEKLKAQAHSRAKRKKKKIKSKPRPPKRTRKIAA